MFLIFSGVVAVVWLAGLPGRIAIARKHPDAEAVKLMGWAGLLPRRPLDPGVHLGLQADRHHRHPALPGGGARDDRRDIARLRGEQRASAERPRPAEAQGAARVDRPLLMLALIFVLLSSGWSSSSSSGSRGASPGPWCPAFFVLHLLLIFLIGAALRGALLDRTRKVVQHTIQLVPRLPEPTLVTAVLVEPNAPVQQGPAALPVRSPPLRVQGRTARGPSSRRRSRTCPC